MTTILTTIWLSDSLREGEHLCFLTFLSPQEKFRFWIAHDRVLPVLSHSPYSSPLNVRLLLSSPLGAKISQCLSQEKTEIMSWPEAHSCLQSLPRRTFPTITLVASLFLSPPLWYRHSPLLSSPRRNWGSLDGLDLISFSANLQEFLAVARNALPGLW